MFNNLKEDMFEVEMGVKNLRRSITFVVNNYDYHHKNNEALIIEEKRKVLNAAETLAVQLKKELSDFETLLKQAEKDILLVEKEIKDTIQRSGIDLNVVGIVTKGNAEGLVEDS